jgi:hypothetical protein
MVLFAFGYDILQGNGTNPQRRGSAKCILNHKSQLTNLSKISIRFSKNKSKRSQHNEKITLMEKIAFLAEPIARLLTKVSQKIIEIKLHILLTNTRRTVAHFL